MNTVTEIFRTLDHAGMEWAVIRNYENLPDLGVADAKNTDLDLVAPAAGIARFRELMREVADRCGWDALTECDHYAQSTVEHHRIHVFRFYRREPLEFLQVDVFHAYLLWGMPVLKEAEMLEGRVSMPQRGLTHIAPVRENMFRLLQVEALLNSRRNGAKRERYRRRLLEYAAAHGPELRREVRTRLSRFALPALGRLRAGAYPAFRWYMRLTRIDFLLRRVLSRPVEVARFILARRSDDRLRFDTRPCGAVVRVNACVQGARDATYAALDALVHANAIDEWLPRAGSSARFSGKERRVLEQGGLLLEFTRGAGHDIAVAEDAAIREVTAALLSFLIHRHSILCGSADFEPHAEAVPA